MSTMMRIAYSGTNFSGWARQAGAIRTVQTELELALSELFGAKIVVRGASRTDSGVHAEAQLAAFDPPAGAKGPPLDRLVTALAGLLPHDAAVWRVWAETRTDGSPAQPRFDNGGKHYRYRIRDGALVPEPRTRSVEWRRRQTLDVEAMKAAAAHFVGRKDFASFRAAGCQSPTTIRTLSTVEIRLNHEETATAGGESRRIIELHVGGEAFLMHMVRIIAGTLVEVGSGRLSPDDIPGLFRTADRTRAGQTAPAHGLTLVQVVWPGKERPFEAGPGRTDR